jgi:hypothetical protein
MARRAGRTACTKTVTRSSGASKLRFRRYDGDAFTKDPNSSRSRRGKDKNKSKDKDKN